MKRAVHGLGILALACAANRMPATHDAPESLPPVTATGFRVGAALADVTPLPGASLFGHGPGARVAEGHWLRLQCRAFYLETSPAVATDASVAHGIVACDLAFVTTLLQRRVALALDCAHRTKPGSECTAVLDAAATYIPRRDPQTVPASGRPATLCRGHRDGSESGLYCAPGQTRPIPAPQLSISATHTHAGPAHYFDSRNLSGTFSSHFPGHDERMVNFLAVRIAQGLLDAQAVTVPAEVRWARGYLWGLKQNASLEAYRRNVDKPTFPWIDPRLLSPEARAVDPTLRTVEFRAVQGSRRLIGSISYYAEHPTVIGNRNQLFGGDVFGVATRDLERRAALKPRGAGEPTPVMALVNTNQGDAHPLRARGNIGDAIAVGTALSTAIWRLHSVAGGVPGGVECLDGLAPEPLGTTHPAYFCVSRVDAWDPKPVLGSRYVEVRLPEAKDPAGEPALCPRGMLGRRSARGNESNPSPTDAILPAPHLDTCDERRVCGKRRKCQCPKAPILPAPLSGVGMGKYSFARVVPFKVMQLGSTVISFVPAEVTLTAGQRINQAVLAELGANLSSGAAADGRPDDAVIAGLSNGYMQYLATREEYELQGYQGASTLYGPASAEFFSRAFGCLAAELAAKGGCKGAASLFGWGGKDGEGGFEAADPLRYKTGDAVDRFPWPRRGLTDQENQRAQAGKLCRMPVTDATEPASYCFWWLDEAPSGVALLSEPWIQLADDGGPLSVDDRGLAFETRFLGPVPGGLWRWSTVFTPERAPMPADIAAVLGETRLRVNTRAAGFHVESLPLQAACACSAEELRRFCRRD